LGALGESSSKPEPGGLGEVREGNPGLGKTLGGSEMTKKKKKKKRGTPETGKGGMFCHRGSGEKKRGK